MSLINIFILCATFACGFVAAVWSGSGWLNIIVKTLFIGLAVVGAICSATVLGLAA